MMAGVEYVVVEGVSFDDGLRAIVIDARPYRPRSCRRGKYGKKAHYHDQGRGTRLWRCSAVVGTKFYKQAEAFRVRCPTCGVNRQPCPLGGPQQLVYACLRGHLLLAC